VISEVFTVERERDGVMIEVRPGPPKEGLTQRQWNDYVIDAVRRWVNKPWKDDEDDNPRIPF
jgi:hypothetical protein